MSSTAVRPGGLRVAALRVLAGRRPWGSLSFAPSRYGVVRYLLVLNPPGLDLAGRVRLRLAAAWDAAAPVTGLAVFVPVAVRLGAALALATTAAVLATGWAAARALTRRQRVGLLRVIGVAGPGPVGPLEVALLADCVERLEAADEALADARMSPVEYELVWAAAHARAVRALAAHPRHG